jgi:hypothetical protein
VTDRAEHPENEQQRQDTEPDRCDGDEAARRRVLDFEPRRIDCEHAEANSTAAVNESARSIDRWDKTSDPLERHYLLDQVGRQMMTVHEAPPPELHEKEMPPELHGQYVDKDFRMEINSELLKRDDPQDALDTYLHEYRHAEQAYEVQASHGSLSHRVNPDRTSDLEFNDAHYVDYTDSQRDYERQLLEVDARTFADETTAEILRQRDALRAAEGRDLAPPIHGDEIASRRVAEADPNDA